ncbi:MAG: PqqD family protein [Synergistaceae bacterium]|nr:PqqD family protein [Synergistaceae bacterium]
MRRNLLDIIPSKKTGLRTETGEDGLLRLVISRESPFEKIVRRFFKKIPDTFTIKLDAYGSFVWDAIDGARNAGEICDMLKDKFGYGVEPVYERLAAYLNLLKNNKLITLR